MSAHLFLKPKPYQPLLQVDPSDGNAPMQFNISNSHVRLDDFDKEYVNFGGYFGIYNPQLFASAPDILTALYQYRDDLRYPPAPNSISRRLAMVEALIGKVESAK